MRTGAPARGLVSNSAIPIGAYWKALRKRAWASCISRAERSRSALPASRLAIDCMKATSSSVKRRGVRLCAPRMPSGARGLPIGVEIPHVMPCCSSSGDEQRSSAARSSMSTGPPARMT